MSGTPPPKGSGGVVAPLGGGSTPIMPVPNNSSLGIPNNSAPTASSGTTPSVGGACGTASDHFCLRWNNYQTNMTAVFDQLLQEEVFVDVTLSCEGGAQLRAHKVVLAACSPYFQAVLQNNPCKHPIIILPHDVVFTDLRAIIEFVYRGEIDVAQEQINSLLQAADTLKIKGLCEVGEDPNNCPPGFTATSTSTTVTGHTSNNNISNSISSISNARTSSLTPTSSSSLSQPPISQPSPTYSQTNNNSTSIVHSRGRPPFSSRGRFNTSYRPRGRPPLYGRHRYDRPTAGGASPRAAPLSRDLRDSKRIKTEEIEEEVISTVVASVATVVNDIEANDIGPHHRLPHPHYQSNQHNGQWNETAGTSHGTGTPEYDSYTYVKSEQHNQTHLQDPNDPTGQRMTVTPELLGLIPSNATSHYSSENVPGTPSGRKLWTDEDMEKALESLRNSAMSLSRAAQLFGIPATTLWQRAHRMGIETPKKEGPNKTWSEHDLAGALEELRSGRLSANRASKEFGIPNSTLYKIARKEGIKLSSPFSAIQPSWNPEDLNRALDAIRGGMSVQKAATEFGIPTGTLYGRCRREGIELSKYQGVPWSEEDMKDALEAVRIGEMSINQAAIHYNLPYSSLYGRFKRGKYEDGLPHQDFLHQEMTIEHYSSEPQNQQPQNATLQQQQPQTPTPPHHSQPQQVPQTPMSATVQVTHPTNEQY